MKKAQCLGSAPKNGVKDRFFPDRGETAEDAIVNFCFKCDVTEECNEYGDRIGATVGVWGGVRRTRNNKEQE